MKKIISLLLCFVMILSSVSVFAATEELGAYSDTYATNVYIEGKAEFGGQTVNIIFYNDDEVGYVNEIKAAEDGTYTKKFKFDGDISGYEIRVRDSETSADITDTLKTAFAQKDIYSVDINLEVGDNDVMHYIKEGDFLKVVADVKNKYADSTKVSVMIAAYSESNTLLATKIKSLNIGYDDLEDKKEVDFSDVVLPEGTVKAKAFVWEDTINLIPVTNEETKVAFEGDLTFVNKNENPDDTWVVGLTGASTVQAGQYAAFLYQYYATRYPDRNIVILNKGCAGCTAKDVYNRLEWDIFNEDDPMGYGACDEIAIMVGANDSKYSSYTHGKMDDDEYESYYDGTKKNGKTTTNMTANIEASFENYKKIVEWCRENGKGVTFTPMTLYDESDDFESTLSYGVCYGSNHAFGMLSDRLEAYAKEEGIPFIDTWGMSNEYTNRIRANTDPDVVNYIKSKKGYVLLGSDGLHHSSEGGYVVGYIIARGQETDPIVAAVDIDAKTSKVTTEDATVSDLTASSTGVSYTYLAKALPMYAKAPGYIHGEKLGIDITNTINKEIIKVSGLDDGVYSITMDGVEVTKVTAQQLAAGVNIATLEKNPGQAQAKKMHDDYYEKRKTNEVGIRQIFNEELRIRNKNSTVHGVNHNDESYKTFTAQDWIDLCNKLIAEGNGTTNGDTYPANKAKQDEYIKNVKSCIEGMKADGVPKSHTVVITKQ